MLLYKLTTQANTTRSTTVWGESVTHTAKGLGKELCSADVIHAYEDPLLAVLLNPIHVAISKPKLWEADGVPVAKAWDKVGCKALTTKREIPLPLVTVEHKVRFAIGCALQVYKDLTYQKWALNWISGKDRSARAAYAAAYAAARADAAARAAYAAYAARAAAYAAAAIDFKEIAKWAVSDAFIEELPGFVSN